MSAVREAQFTKTSFVGTDPWTPLRMKSSMRGCRRRLVRDGRDLPVGVHRAVAGLVLCAAGDVDGNQPIRNRQFFDEDVHLVPIGAGQV